jgi:hypothetical protein
MRVKSLITIVLSLALALLLASTADAQRRRRRPAPPVEEPPPAEQPPPEGAQVPPEGETPPAEGAEGGEAAPVTPETPETTEPAAEVEREDPLAEEPLGPDLAPIRQEFTSIMDELVQVRSRVAVLGRQLFRTRMRVEVQNRAGNRQALARLVLRLDGAPIYQGEGGEVPEDGRQVFDGFAAPGPHVLSIELEQRSRADAEYRYTLRDTYRFQVVRERLTEVVLILDDDSNIAEDFEGGGEGKFEVKTRVRVATRALGEQ